MSKEYLTINNTQLTVNLSGTIPLSANGKRLDQALAIVFPLYSRENLKQWILNGSCLVNDKILKPKFKVQGGELIKISAKLTTEYNNWLAQDLPLNVIYEDPDILVFNKQNNIIMHPGAGNKQGTILNALLNHCSELRAVPRAGIIHRLDKDTTGLIIVAKNLIAHNNLILQFKNHQVTKIYEAIVYGNLIAGGTVNAPIGRHQHNRVKMSVTTNGKQAITHYRILKKFKDYTYIRLQIETGRTHQIRVHMKHINHPIVGDRLYASARHQDPKINCTSQVLHAKELLFNHPTTQNKLHFVADLPYDFTNLLEYLNTRELNLT